MNNFKEIANLLEEIKNTQGTIAKLDLLESHYQKPELQEDLKLVLIHLFDTTITTGIAKKSWNNIKTTKDISFESILGLIRFIQGNNTGKDEIIEQLKYIDLTLKTSEEKQLLYYIATKDVVIGINQKMIQNRLNIFQMFEIMLGSSLKEAKLDTSKDFYLTRKLDGCNITVIKRGSEVSDIVFMTRNGKRKEGLDNLAQEYLSLPNGVYFGEAMYSEEIGDRGAMYRMTVSELNSDKQDKKIVHNIFDMLSLEDWDKRQSTMTYDETFKYVESLLSDVNCPHIQLVEKVFVGQEEFKEIKKHLDQALAKGWEGLMLRYSDSKYEWKRSNNLIKLKQFYSVDLRIIGWEEFKYPNQLGAFIVNYKGNELKVGTGFTAQQRKDFWKDRESYLNKIIEVQAFEETTNKENQQKSLRFPVFVQFRFDKDEESYD